LNGHSEAPISNAAIEDAGSAQHAESIAAERDSGFGQKKGKKWKKGKGQDTDGRDKGGAGFKSNQGWTKVLRPFKSIPLADAIIGTSAKNQVICRC
jgi:hypothetical protein